MSKKKEPTGEVLEIKMREILRDIDHPAVTSTAINCGYVTDVYGRKVQVQIVLHTDRNEWISD